MVVQPLLMTAFVNFVVEKNGNHSYGPEDWDSFTISVKSHGKATP
jgi:hypothetical protein